MLIVGCGYYCSLWPMEQKAWIDVKCPRFFIWKAIQYIGVFVSGVKPLIPTKLKLSIVIKIYDIIFPGSQAAGDANCYLSAILTNLIYCIYPYRI
jgi:hypothetical protein